MRIEFIRDCFLKRLSRIWVMAAIVLIWRRLLVDGWIGEGGGGGVMIVGVVSAGWRLRGTALGGRIDGLSHVGSA